MMQYWRRCLRRASNEAEPKQNTKNDPGRCECATRIIYYYLFIHNTTSSNDTINISSIINNYHTNTLFQTWSLALLCFNINIYPRIRSCTYILTSSRTHASIHIHTSAHIHTFTHIHTSSHIVTSTYIRTSTCDVHLPG